MSYKTIIVCVLLGITLGILTGCSETTPKPRYEIICLEGVAYWQGSDNGIAPKYSDGYDMPDTCS